MLRLGACAVVTDGGGGLAAGVARLDLRTRLGAVVEKSLDWRDASIFREVVTFL